MVARLYRREELLGGEETPRADSVNCTPALAADPPVSCQTAWLSRLTITSSPGSGEHAQRNLVRHRAARQPKRRFLAEQRGDAPLQLVHGRVFAVLVITDGSGGHGRAHCR